MVNLFFSYSRKHPVYADFLSEDLERDGYSTFIDRDGIHGSEDWRITIHRAVERCNAIIVIVTYDAAHSEYVQEEVRLAISLGKPCFPLIMEILDIDENLNLLGCPNSQAIDFVKLRRKDAYSRLLRSLEYATDTLRPLEAWLARLNHYNPRVRREAVNKLCESGDARILLPLTEAALFEEDTDIYKATIEGMCFFNSPIAIGFVRDALANEIKQTKPRLDIPLAAIKVLSRIGVTDSRAKDLCVEALKVKQNHLRIQFAAAILKFPDPILGQMGFEALVDLLKSRQSSVARGAAVALARTGDKRAIPYLEPFLATTNGMVRDTLEQALKKLREIPDS